MVSCMNSDCEFWEDGGCQRDNIDITWNGLCDNEKKDIKESK